MNAINQSFDQKIKEIKEKFHAEREAETQNLKTLEDQIAQMQEEAKTAIETINKQNEAEEEQRAKRFEMSKENEKNQGCNNGSNWCLKEDKKVTTKHFNKYCSTNDYDQCQIYKENITKSCFFTTILCEKLSQPLVDNPILYNLKTFRKNILEQDAQYQELLTYHDRLSPIISNAIRNNSIQTINDFIEIIYSSYILPINKFILNGDIDNAIRRYEKMRELLIVNFGLEQEYYAIRTEYNQPEFRKEKRKIRLPIGRKQYK